ncbi:uncharacterized protein Dsimw501_GD29451 [Drosophila simulans]|nr:uncharacterized protein Dsimw501_GD29451 [Drosophila simulans]
MLCVAGWMRFCGRSWDLLLRTTGQLGKPSTTKVREKLCDWLDARVGANYPKTSAGVRRPELSSSHGPLCQFASQFGIPPKTNPKWKFHSEHEHNAHSTSKVWAAVFRRPATGGVKRGYQRVKQGVMGATGPPNGVGFWPTSLHGQDDERQERRTENVELGTGR